ncbi:MAG: hypothetical protein IJS17_04595 [Clostridia bacterium]|nr:hypothetical protein [Clostridia bacterium]
MALTLKSLKDYYGGMLDKGATTFWEDFDIDWIDNSTRIDEFPQENKRDIHGDFGRYCYVGYRHSLCHGWSSAPSAFLMEKVLGVTILKPGCKELSIKANLGDLSYAKGEYPTPYGNIIISHKKLADGSIETKISAPEEIKII